MATSPSNKRRMPRKTCIEFSSSSNNCSDISSYRDDEYFDDDYDDDDDEELDPLTAPLVELIDQVADYDAPSLGWDNVRTYFRCHSLEETKAAIESKGEFDTTALHVACRSDPLADMVIQYSADPENAR